MDQTTVCYQRKQTTGNLYFYLAIFSLYLLDDTFIFTGIWFLEYLLLIVAKSTVTLPKSSVMIYPRSREALKL